MWTLLNICVLLNLHFILTKCDLSQNPDNLSVQKLNKKLIERNRQDTRDMCKMFNLEATGLQTEALPFNKYDKRKKELKLKEKKEELQKIKTRRVKREVNSVNPALNVEDEQRVETIVDKIYDDLLEKGQKIAYRRRRKGMPKAEVNNNSSAASKTGRRFPFAPVRIDGPTTTKSQNMSEMPELSKPVRFVHAIVPYFIDSRTYDTHLSDIIMKAFDYFEKATCIRLQRLRERPTDPNSLQNVNWLYITNPSGTRQCVHSNERAQIKGVQMIVFGYDCMSLGDIAHEIMHVLGFAHEHVRPDRNQHITIFWDNIKPGFRKYFEVHNKPIVESLPYDYASVMHYPPRAFSKNGQVTILTEPGIKIGQREGLSEMDVEKIGMLYSSECIKRNREYLRKTCPSVVKSDTPPTQVPLEEIEDYFKDRLWPYGVINYKLRDLVEFSSEERENINAVIAHLEKETCVEFRDLTSYTNTVPDEASSSDNNFDSDDIDKIEKCPEENESKAVLPETSTASEENTQNVDMDNLIVDPVKIVRNGVKGKNISGVKGKAANTEVKEKNTNMGLKGKHAHIGAKGRTANVTRKQSVLKKRAVPPSPSRSQLYHQGSSLLVLSRSPQPGCHCPQPGKPDGSYEFKINTDCFNSVNDLLHIFVHMLGLDHQHITHDRDYYLQIVWDQLTDEVKQDMKSKLPPAASVGFQYDYQSVMHYPWLQIKNGKTNIMYPIWNDGWAMGHWQGLSSIDVQKINLLYFKQCLLRKQQDEEELQRAENQITREPETQEDQEDDEQSDHKSDADDELIT